MSDLRNNLEHAKHAYKRLQYDGDLAVDVFARLDAERAASMAIDRPAKRGFNWRPLLAIAAAVAVVATTVLTLTSTGRDKPGPELADNGSFTTILTERPTGETPTKTTGESVAQATDEATAFTVVPSYQSFAISVPTSLSLASIDEYDRQAQEQASTPTASESTPALQ